MSDDFSARLSLPYLAAGQMQKHVTLNEALTRLDALTATAVVSRTTATQPAAPADGDLYILPAGATGVAWAGRPEGVLMRFESGAWSAVDAPAGLVAVVRDAQEAVMRLDDEWRPVGAAPSVLQNLTRLGVGTTADADNPIAAKVNKMLFAAQEAWAGGDGDLRLTLNKETASDVLSLLFQSGWGGRAELGLIGGDDLSLKVSADGGTWRQAFAVDRTSGRVSFDRGAARREAAVFTSGGTYAPPDWARWIEVLCIGGGGGGGSGMAGASGLSRFGGGGGGAGGLNRDVWPAEALGGALSITVGAGGEGGAASSGVGASGFSGGDSQASVGGVTLLKASGGGGGGGGTGSAGSAGAGGLGARAANAGGAASTTASGGAGGAGACPDGPGGGAGGGGLSTANLARAGGAGGSGGFCAVLAAGGAGGAAAGSAGQAAPLPDLCRVGGGGGGGGASASAAGFAGGAGGGRGAGGGGGGAGVALSGAGGAGAGGVVVITAVG